MHHRWIDGIEKDVTRKNFLSHGSSDQEGFDVSVENLFQILFV